jgi:hypothetical protein
MGHISLVSGCIERQDLLRPLYRSQEDPLSVPIRRTLAIVLDLRRPKQGDQEANHCSEQSRATPKPFDFGSQIGMIMGGEIGRNHLGRATVNPAPNGSARDVQLGKEKEKPSSIPIAGLADGLLDSVVVGP